MIQQFHSGHLPRSKRDSNWKRYMYPNVHCSTIFNSQDMETTYVSINRWIKKKGYTHMRAHTHTHTQWNTINWLKKKGILPFLTAYMDLEGMMLSEISQWKTNTVWSHLYVNLKRNKTKLIDTENRWMVAARGDG